MSDNINLTDYILERVYGKTESYNQSQIDALLDVLREQSVELFEIVTELPTYDIRTNRLYLVYNNKNIEEDLFDTYLYANGNWERLDLNLGINDFYTSNQINNLLLSKAETDDLNETINVLNRTKDNLTSLYNNLSDFNEVLIDFSDDNTNLSNDLSKLKDNLSVFITRVNILINDMIDAQSDIAQSKKDIIIFEDNINDLQEADEDITGQLNILGTALNGDGTNENKGLINSLKDTNDNLTDLTTSFNNTKSDFENTKTVLTDTKNLTLTLDKQLNGDETDPNDNGLKGQVTVLENDLTLLENDNSILNTNLENLQDDLNNTQSQLDNLDGNITGLSTRLTNLDDSINNSSTGLKISLDNLNERLIADEEVFTKTGTDTIALKNRLNAFIDDLGILGSYLTSFQGNLTDLNNTLEENNVTLGEDINSNILNLFASIGTVKASVNEINTVSIPKLESDLDDVTVVINGDPDNDEDTGLVGAISNTENRLNTVEENIDNVENSITNVNTIIGDPNNPSNESLRGQIKQNTTDITNTQTSINDVQTDINTTKTILYGSSNGDSNHYTNNSMMGNLDNITVTLNGDSENDGLISQVDNTINIIGDEQEGTGLFGTIQTIDNKVDTARQQINESLEYINNVQKIVYGDNTYYYTCNENEWTTIKIDTTEITDIQYLKFLVYPINQILIKNINNINNGDFSQNLTNWNISNENNITIETIEDENVCRLNSQDMIMILSRDDIDFTNIDELSFKVRADDKDPLTDVINGLFIYIGEEEENTGLLDTLTNFSTTLTRVDTGLNTVKNDVNTLQDDFTRIDSDVDDINQVLYDDETDPSDVKLGLISNVDNVLEDVDTVQNNITDINNLIDNEDNEHPGLKQQINNTQSNLNSANNNITNILTELFGTGSDKDNANGNSLWNKIKELTSNLNSAETVLGESNATTGDSIWAKINNLITRLTSAEQDVNDIESTLYKGDDDSTKTNPSDGTVMKNIIDIEDVNQLIKNSINNLFIPPSTFNKQVTNIYIPMNQSMIDIQELLIMEYDYNYNIEINDYIYIIPKDKTQQGILYRRTAKNWNADDFTRLNTDDDGLPSDLTDAKILYNIYRLGETNDGLLRGELGISCWNPLEIEYIFEISTNKYYTKTIINN